MKKEIGSINVFNSSSITSQNYEKYLDVMEPGDIVIQICNRPSQNYSLVYLGRCQYSGVTYVLFRNGLTGRVRVDEVIL